MLLRAAILPKDIMVRFIASACFACLMALPPLAFSAELPQRTLRIGEHELTVEVASTPATRETGLMNRFSLQQDHGMLFVFEAPQPLAFWMKNTYIPLSIAFIDRNGRILNIEDMRPQDETTHGSKGPAVYAIEMKQGWFAAKGIAAGDVVTGLTSP